MYCAVLLLVQEAMKFVTQYGTERVRLLEFVRNRGKGGAVRMVRIKEQAVSFYIILSFPFSSAVSCRAVSVVGVNEFYFWMPMELLKFLTPFDWRKE